jgi:hypothetical protein
MSTATENDIPDSDSTCDDSAPVWPVLLASGSALLLGYVVGRISYSRDLRQALHRIDESPEPITVSIRTL